MESRPNKKNISRRAFLAGSAIAGVVALSEGPAIIRKADKLIEDYEAYKLKENIEGEKLAVIKDVEAGIAKQHESDTIMKARNQLVREMQTLDRRSNEYANKESEVRGFNRMLNLGGFIVHRGTDSVYLMAEANPYAELFKKNDVAVAGLAVARVLYRETSSDENFDKDKEFQYWHNLALAYLELGHRTQEQIITRFKELVEYIKIYKLRLVQIPPETILYSIIDENFDFKLKPKDVEVELDKKLPSWKKYPATHANKDSYSSYNNLSALDIFDLNRLRRVILQLKDSAFVADLFKARDEDVKNTGTEFGGVIPLMTRENRLRILSSAETGYNGGYTPPNELFIESLRGAADFHFHATKIKEPDKHQGPSSGDSDFFNPGVVFSSVDDSTILVHFYVSRMDGGRSFSNEVICLGEIKKIQ